MISTKPQRVTVKTLKGDWTQQSGYHAVQSWLSLSTSWEMNIGMIACQNDDMANGARRAFEELKDMKVRDRWLQLPIIGCDGVARAGQAWVRQGRLAATVLSPPLVGDALKMLVNSRKTGGQPPERTLITPSSLPAIADLKKTQAKSVGKGF